MQAEAYFTPEEVAEDLGLSRRWVYEMLWRGELAGYQKYRAWRIRPAELYAFRKRWKSRIHAKQVLARIV